MTTLAKPFLTILMVMVGAQLSWAVAWGWPGCWLA